MDIFRLISVAKAVNAHELFLCAGSPPMWCIKVLLEKADSNAPLTEGEVQQALHQLATPLDVDRFRLGFEVNFTCELTDGTRLRCNALRGHDVVSLDITILPAQQPRIVEQEQPSIYNSARMARTDKGNIFISGRFFKEAVHLGILPQIKQPADKEQPFFKV